MMYIVPDWPVAKRVRAISSLRDGGVSSSPFSSLNVGMHVGDNEQNVLENRSRLAIEAAMPSAPVWLNQTHSSDVLELFRPTGNVLDGDASFTSVAGVVCAAMTADCLPVLLAGENGEQVAAVHAGWRGLADGIVEKAAAKFSGKVIAWLGPAIGPDAFEVGQDVFDEFVSQNKQAQQAFRPSDTDANKYYANMHLLATQALNRVGITDIYRDSRCTYLNPEQFFSYRRDGKTGRQVTCIWIDAEK
ncbi:peptidoglycan editing factor PgeF [Vibrio agarivorans]|uniref:peptidoglycan editing factor PgeF n=1 Tax=Vibrio agarivorans TaxID=153622 RepID=UPI00222FA3DF|nr:peptidoglycan editing factor PgeF [Vibrio agarivorans]